MGVNHLQILYISSGPWSSDSGLPADKISGIERPAVLVWLFFSIEISFCFNIQHYICMCVRKSYVLLIEFSFFIFSYACECVMAMYGHACSNCFRNCHIACLYVVSVTMTNCA